MVKRVVKSRGEHILEGDEQLLPGIPNEITLSLIAPKLPWRAFYILALVSRCWQRAIQSRQVYHARVCSKLTQTLVPLHCERRRVSTIGLYSMGETYCCHLPGIPGAKNGLPAACEWIPLDGKIYVLGGYKGLRISSNVYVFDLAGQGQWKQIASMQRARKHFGCGVKDDKIYVFGGSSNPKFARGSEVYDPKEDAWSPISPCPSKVPFESKVTTVGEELFLHHEYEYRNHDILCAEVYDPHKDEWRIVEHFIRSGEDKLLMVGGKLHRLNRKSIEIYDVDANSWKSSQQNLSGVEVDDVYGYNRYGASEVLHFRIDDMRHAVAVDDDILAVVNLTTIGEDDREKDCLITIQGLGRVNTDIVCQRLHWPPSLDLVHCSPGMYPIRL